ncbi:transposase [Bradyrhizobium sp. i1.8.4]
MKQYVGLDISMEETSICVLDQTGSVTFEGCVPTNPEAIAKLLRRHADNAERIVFETGSLSNWLWHQLKALGFPVICLDARHAKAALSMRINKSDHNDAKGLAEMARMGWYREAAVKGAESWKTRSMLAARTKLLNLRRDIDNQMRGLCKGFGIVLGKAGSTNLARKVDAVLAEAPDLQDIFAPLVLAQSCLTERIERSDRQPLAVAKRRPNCSANDDRSRYRSPDCPVLRRNHRQPHSLQTFRRRGCLSRPDTKTLSIRRDGSYWPHLQTRQPPDANLSVRGRERPADRCQARFCVQALGQQAGQTHRRQKGQGTVARKMAVILHAIWTDGTEFQAEMRTA